MAGQGRPVMPWQSGAGQGRQGGAVMRQASRRGRGAVMCQAERVERQAAGEANGGGSAAKYHPPHPLTPSP